jgi:hypothetical protein
VEVRHGEGVANRTGPCARAHVPKSTGAGLRQVVPTHQRPAGRVACRRGPISPKPAWCSIQLSYESYPGVEGRPGGPCGTARDARTPVRNRCGCLAAHYFCAGRPRCACLRYIIPRTRTLETLDTLKARLAQLRLRQSTGSLGCRQPHPAFSCPYSLTCKSRVSESHADTRPR